MKTFNKALVATGLAIASCASFADPIVIDTSYMAGYPTDVAPFDTDGNSLTAGVDALTINASSTNVSNYVDNNGVAGIQTGDYVFDLVQDRGIGLNLGTAANNGSNTELYSSGWAFDIDYMLEGFAALVPDTSTPTTNYVGVFTGGWANIDLTDLISNTVYDDVLKLELTGSNGTPISGGQNALTFTFKIVDVVSGLFFSNGNDLADLLGANVVLNMKANADLQNQSNAPVLDGTYEIGGTTYDKYTRTTSLGSIDLRLVSEPSTLAIFGLSLLGLAGVARRKAK